MPRFPLVPSLLVLTAVAIMIALGFWQLGRLEEKEALIDRYQAALIDKRPIAWPMPTAYKDSLFRTSQVECREVRGVDSISGKSASGRSGWVHVARCSHAGSGLADVTIGWSRDPKPPEWSGGKVSGLISPYGDGIRLIAAEPRAGLEPLAEPDPGDLPNNHLAYAVQWFIFAATALVIYVLALRRKQRGG